MSHYVIRLDASSTVSDPLLRISFGEPAQNDQVIPDALGALAALALPGGRSIRFNGPCSVPLAMALAHAVGHLYGYVACFDPKMEHYIVVISHHPDFHAGQLVE